MQKLYILLLWVLIPICLAGCWDSAELQDLSIVSGIGIDKGGDSIDNRYRTTVQIINPSQVAGGQQGGKVQSSPVTTFTATGSTLKESLRKISHKAPAQLFFPHVQVMLIGEELANEGILELFDLIERDPNFRVLFPILVVRENTAEDALKVTTSLIPVPSLKVVESLESSAKIWSEYPSSRVDQVIANLKKGSFNITGIKINGDVETGNKSENMQQIHPPTTLEINGLALFKKGKIETWLEDESARGVMWAKNEIKKTIVSLDCPKKKDAISIDILRAQSDIHVNMRKEKPVINLTIVTEGSISETQCNMALEKNKTINELEAQLSKEIKDEVLKTVKFTQEGKVDVFGFGSYINIEDKKYWKKIEGKWEDEIYPEMEINVNVLVAIRRTGMRINTYLK
ncbi:Ger(x)C family spore germination protein [Mesobacillus foraminis]|uniref:Ger(x)C family spore germination protein n=1 Tax=Mesobacillus foraminis TaxID=279826 RepID=UPI0039A0C1D1